MRSYSATDQPPAGRPAQRGRGGVAGLVITLLALAGGSYALLSPTGENLGRDLTSLPAASVEIHAPIDQNATLAQLLSADAPFRPWSEFAAKTPPSTSGPRVVWLRLTLPNDTPEPLSAVLEFQDREADNIDVFLTANNGDHPDAPSARTGQLIPWNARSVPSHLPAIGLILPAHATTVCHARVASETLPPGRVTLWSSAGDFQRHAAREALPLAFFFGLWFALLLGHAIAATVARDPGSWLSLAWLAAGGAAILLKTHLLGMFAPSLPVLTREVALVSLTLLASYMLVQFCRGLLASRHHGPAADTLLAALAWTLGMATLASPTLLLQPAWVPGAVAAGVYAALFTAVALLAAAIHLWFRGSRDAGLAALAHSCFAVGAIWMLLSTRSQVPPGRATAEALLLGLTLQALFLTLASVRRALRQREEQDQAQTSQLTRLKREVADRTGDLMSASHRLSQASQAGERLVSILAHDVRATVGSIVAASRAPANQLATTQLTAITQQGGALIDLLNDTLDWARLRNGKFPHRPAAAPLAAIIENALRSLDALAAEKGVRVERQVPGDLIVQADREALECVARILIGHAIRFTTAGGAVRIEATATDRAAVEMRVHDNGAGLTPEQLSNIQSATDPNPRAGGRNGDIGLALALELLERDHGSLAIESALGRGTTTVATIPLELTRDRDGRAAEPERAHAAPAPEPAA